MIQHNKQRFFKNLKAFEEKDHPIIIKSFPQYPMELDYLAEEIQNLENKGIPIKNIAVLFRMNTQASRVIGKLMEYNIPFQAKEVVPNVFDHWITQHIFTYIRIATGSRKRRDFLKICNRPNRYISRDAFEKEQVDFQHLYNFYSDKDWMLDRIKQLEYDLDMLKDMPPYGAIQYIRKVIGYDTYLEEYAQYRKMRKEELFDVLDEITDSAKMCKTYAQWFAFIEQYGMKLKEQTGSKKEVQGVQLMTMHSSKGLEFEAVFIIDVNEGITPYKRSVLEEDIEEERRMFYVSMTRAKKYLYLLYSKNRYQKDLEPSRFLTELQKI